MDVLLRPSSCLMYSRVEVLVSRTPTSTEPQNRSFKSRGVMPKLLGNKIVVDLTEGAQLSSLGTAPTPARSFTSVRCCTFRISLFEPRASTAPTRFQQPPNCGARTDQEVHRQPFKDSGASVRNRAVRRELSSSIASLGCKRRVPAAPSYSSGTGKSFINGITHRVTSMGAILAKNSVAERLEKLQASLTSLGSPY